MPHAVVGVNGKPCQWRHTTTSSWLKSVVSLFPHLHTPSPLFFPSLISLMVLWTLSTIFTYLCFLSAPPTSNTVSALLTYIFFPPRLPPALSQPYLLMFSVGPAYLQHCLSPTYLCFFLRPRLPPTLSQSYLLMFFPSAPLTSSRVSASASSLDVDSLLPPCEWGGWREEEEGEGC